MEIMHQLNIDILALQETKVNLCTEEFKTIEGTDKVYKLFFSSDKNVPNPSAALQARPQVKTNPRNFSEHHGVGFVMGPKFGNFVSDCIPHNGRIIELHIRNPGPNIRIINHYALHSARPFAKKKSSLEPAPQHYTETQAANMPTFVVGGTNARLHGRLSGLEETMVGRHVFGWGLFFVD